MSDKLRDQINELIRDEIQDVINDYVDAQDETQKAGLGFVGKEDEKELKVNITIKVEFCRNDSLITRARNNLIARAMSGCEGEWYI